MKKKIIALLLCLTILCLTGCGNSDIATYDFDYAILKLPNGEIIEGVIENSNCFVGSTGMVKIKIDGITYQIHGANIVYVSE